MTTDRDDPPRRQAERMIHDARDVPVMGRGEPFYPPPNPGAVQWLSEAERDKVESLIRQEPEITAMVEQRKSWKLVLGTLKTVAVWLTAMSGGMLVIREVLKVMNP